MSRFKVKRFLFVCFIAVLAWPLHAAATIIYVGDQGFTKIDGSGSEAPESIRLANVETDLIFFEQAPLRLPGWQIRQEGPSSDPEVYQSVFGENRNEPIRFDTDDEIGPGLDWQGLQGGDMIAGYAGAGEGNFVDAHGFLGMRIFGEESQPYYGWIRIEHSLENATFTVHDWAWNSASGEPILAGEIPEPATYAKLLGLGMLLFVLVRRHLRRKANLNGS